VFLGRGPSGARGKAKATFYKGADRCPPGLKGKGKPAPAPPPRAGGGGKTASPPPLKLDANPLRKVLVLDRLVALAGACFQGRTIEDGNPAAAIAEDAALLQLLGK